MYTKLTYNDVRDLAEWAWETSCDEKMAQDADMAWYLLDGVDPKRAPRWVRRTVRRLLAQAIVAFQVAALRGEV